MVEVEVLIPRKEEQKGVADWTFRMLMTLVTLAHSDAGKLLSLRLSPLSGEAQVMAVHRERSPGRRTPLSCITKTVASDES